MKDTRKQHSQFTMWLSGTADNARDNKEVPCNKLTICYWSVSGASGVQLLRPTNSLII